MHGFLFLPGIKGLIVFLQASTIIFTKTKIVLILSTAKKASELCFCSRFKNTYLYLFFLDQGSFPFHKAKIRRVFYKKNFFHKKRFFFAQGSFSQTRVFPQKRISLIKEVFQKKKDFSLKKEVFHKKRFFLDQGSFP